MNASQLICASLAGGVLLALMANASARAAESSGTTRPNVILCMSDDQGWGDTRYNGHSVLHMPHLEQLASKGLRFDRFYAASPQCSPTRGSVLTGRHPYRYGVLAANVGRLPPEEITLAEILQSHGYRTGLFGKWHLGTLSTTDASLNRGSGAELVANYSPPWRNGFDVGFCTESKVPTWDPMIGPSEETPFREVIPDHSTAPRFGTPYYREDGSQVTDNLLGDDSRVIMDRAIPFIQESVSKEKPFFAVIWFHSPHMPVVAGERYTALYPQEDRYQQHYYGCLTALDEQLGRLEQELEELGVTGNTMWWYCSDNGPERKFGVGAGSTGKLRGHKRALFEGGVRVPAWLVWPDKVQAGTTTDVPASTCDYLPTILDFLDLPQPTDRPIDGISLRGLIEGKWTSRPSPIPFEFPVGDRSAGSPPLALIGNRYKLLTDLGDGQKDMLFDLANDPEEAKDLSQQMPDKVQEMKTQLARWRSSCDASRAGKDYGD